jgi:septum formation protein
MSSLILASTSPYRRAQLEQLGVAFACENPDVDEDPWHNAGLAASELVQQLSRAKAEAVAARHRVGWVIGADQVGVIDDVILTKPGTASRAVAQLSQLSGRTHQLLTGVTVIRVETGEVRTELDITELSMRALSGAQLERYVERDAPLACAGSYRFESLGAALFSHIRSEDPTAIVGLPLLRVTRLLSALGYEVLA